MGFHVVDFPLVGGSHGPAGAVDHVLGVQVFLAPEFGEFPETGLENPLHGPRIVPVMDGALVQGVQIAAAPEIPLELVGAGVGVPHGEPFAENVEPGHERHGRQDGHDHLDHGTGVGNEFDDGKVLADVHCRVSSFSRRKAGMGVAFMGLRLTQTTFTVLVRSRV